MFIPKFCPNHHCSLHSESVAFQNQGWYQHYGFHYTKIRGAVQRFRCSLCGKTFSTQTFRVSYYDKLEVDYEVVLKKLVSCHGIRETARAMGLNHKVIARRQAKLVPQAVSFHARHWKDGILDQTLVADRVESFAHSHNYPTSIPITAGQKSRVAWGFTIQTHGQNLAKRKTQQLGMRKFERCLDFKSNSGKDKILELFESLNIKGNESKDSINIITNDQEIYVKAFEKAGMTKNWKHLRVSTKTDRNQKRQLSAFENLQFHIRKDLAEHVPHTLCYAKRPERQIGRLALYLAWYHGSKPYDKEESQEESIKPLECVGLNQSAVKQLWINLFEKRSFGSQEKLQTWHQRIWNRQDRNLNLSQQYVPNYLRCVA